MNAKITKGSKRRLNAEVAKVTQRRKGGGMKQRIAISIALLILVGSVWFVITLRRVANDQLDASNRGHMYRNFFGVLEMYTEQTGEFPASLDDMLTIDAEFGYEGVRWPQDAQGIADLIQPNFDITPNLDNLGTFAPDYKINASWGDAHCEFYWILINEHLETGS